MQWNGFIIVLSYMFLILFTYHIYREREHGPTLISSHHAMSDGNSRWNNNKTIRNVLLLRVTLCLLGANVWSLGLSRFEDPNSWMVYPPIHQRNKRWHLGQGHAEAFQMCLTVQKNQVGTRKSVAWFMISLYVLSIIEKFGDFVPRNRYTRNHYIPILLTHLMLIAINHHVDHHKYHS